MLIVACNSTIRPVRRRRFPRSRSSRGQLDPLALRTSADQVGADCWYVSAVSSRCLRMNDNLVIDSLLVLPLMRVCPRHPYDFSTGARFAARTAGSATLTDPVSQERGRASDIPAPGRVRPAVEHDAPARNALRSPFPVRYFLSGLSARLPSRPSGVGASNCPGFAVERTSRGLFVS